MAHDGWAKSQRGQNGQPGGISSLRNIPRKGCPTGRGRRVQARDRSAEAARVRMPRVDEQHVGRGDLDQVTRIHDTHPIGNFGEHSQIVRHVEHRHAEPGAQIREQLNDLLLRGDIESGGRLVQDQQVGRARECHGDHHALLLSARELMRIAAANAPRLGQADKTEQLVDAFPPVGALLPTVPTAGPPRSARLRACRGSARWPDSAGPG